MFLFGKSAFEVMFDILDFLVNKQKKDEFEICLCLKLFECLIEWHGNGVTHLIPIIIDKMINLL